MIDCNTRTDYVKKYQGEVVETDLFRRCLEGSSGVGLVRFFDQWWVLAF